MHIFPLNSESCVLDTKSASDKLFLPNEQHHCDENITRNCINVFIQIIKMSGEWWSIVEKKEKFSEAYRIFSWNKENFKWIKQSSR